MDKAPTSESLTIVTDVSKGVKRKHKDEYIIPDDPLSNAGGAGALISDLNQNTMDENSSDEVMYLETLPDENQIDLVVYKYFLAQKSQGNLIGLESLYKIALEQFTYLGGKSENFSKLKDWQERWKNRFHRRNLPELRKRPENLYINSIGKTSSNGPREPREPRKIAVRRKIDPSTKEKRVECKAKTIFSCLEKIKRLVPHQVFHCDIIDIDVSTMPCKIYSYRQGYSFISHKRKTTQLTLMACTNASGSMKLPLMILGLHKEGKLAKSGNQNANKLLPFYYHNRDFAGMDLANYSAWLNQYCVPHMKYFLGHNTHSQESVLMIDQASRLEAAKYFSFNQMHIVTLPDELNHYIDQVSLKLMAHFRNLIKEKLGCDESDPSYKTQLSNFSNPLDYRDIVLLLHQAWARVSAEEIRDCWQKMFEFKSKSNDNQEEYEKAKDCSNERFVRLFNDLPGFEGITKGDVQEWIGDYSENTTKSTERTSTQADRNLVEDTGHTVYIKAEPLDEPVQAIVPDESSTSGENVIGTAQPTISIVNVRSLQQVKQEFPEVESSQSATADNVEEPRSEDDDLECDDEDVKAKKCCEFLVTWAQKNREVVTMEQYSQLLSVQDSINLKIKGL